MFLLDAHYMGGNVALLFKLPNQNYKVWKLPPCNHILIRCAKHMNSFSPDCFVYGKIYGELTLSPIRFAKLRTQCCNECELFDTDLNIRTKTLFEYGIELYKFYTYKGIPSIDHNEGDIIDPAYLNPIPIDSKLNWKDFLKIVTISFSLQSEGEMGLVVPEITELSTRATGMASKEIELGIGLTPIINIMAISGNEQKIFFPDLKSSKMSDHEREKMMICKFLDWIALTDPDIIQIFNAIQLEFLYLRCKHHVIEQKFITAFNRPSKFKGFFISDYRKINFPPYYNYKYKCKTPYHLNFNDYSKESTEYSFGTALVGRVLFNYFAMAQRRDVLETQSITSKTIDYWHPIFISKYLPTLLTITGRYHLTVECYSSKLTMTQWIIKKEFGELLLYRPIVEYVKKRDQTGTLLQETLQPNPIDNNNNKESDLKIFIDKDGSVEYESKFDKNTNQGGEHFVVNHSLLYPKSTEFHYVDVDLASFYANIIIETNVDRTTLNPLQPDPDLEISSFLSHKVISTTSLQGIIPRALKNMITQRNAVKHNMNDKSISQETRDSLSTTSQALKLASAIVYGCLGNKSRYNRISAPEVASFVTEIGRDIWNNLKEFIEKNGHIVIHGNTDGFILKTSNLDSLKSQLSQFVSNTKIKCYPEMRRKFKSIFVKNTNNWIAIDESDCLINKNVIKSTNPEIQIDLEKALYKLLLSNPPGKKLMEQLIEDFQNYIFGHNDIFNPSEPLNYFTYYQCHSPKFTLFFMPPRYIDSLKESVLLITNHSHSNAKALEKCKTTVEEIILKFMPF